MPCASQRRRPKTTHLRMPSPPESRALRLGKGVPVARILRTTYATDGRAVEVTDQILAGDRYVLCYETPARVPSAEAPTT
jgi:DNA-binding GntR family transcriptional regulator